MLGRDFDEPCQSAPRCSPVCPLQIYALAIQKLNGMIGPNPCRQIKAP